MGSHQQFWRYAICNQLIFLFVKEVGGHLNFVKFPLWQKLWPFVTLNETSKTQAETCAWNPLCHPSIICSWKLVICVVKHISKINSECWYTSGSIDTEPPNIIILEVVQNSICTISILIANQSSKLVKWALNIVWWYKCQSTDHSRMQNKFWIIYVPFLQPQLLKAFLHIGKEVIKITMHLEKRSK